MTRVERGILRGLEEAIRFERAAGAATVRTHVRTRAGTVVIEARGYRGRQIRRIRGDLRLSQPVFASLLNVSPETVKAWEQGKRVPEGAAVRLLEVAEDYPGVLLHKLRVRRGR